MLLLSFLFVIYNCLLAVSWQFVVVVHRVVNNSCLFVNNSC